MRGGGSQYVHYVWSLACGQGGRGLDVSYTVGHMSMQSLLSVDLTHTQGIIHCTLLNNLTNLNMDSLTDSLLDKSQCDQFCVSIPLNWWHSFGVNYSELVGWHQALYVPYVEHLSTAKSC